MASFSSFFLGGDPTATTPPGYHQVSPMADPSFSGLYQETKAGMPTGMEGLTALIGQGMNSPLLQQILGPALARLMGTEQTSRDAVTDAARSAGSLRSTAYGQSFAQNEQNIMQNRANLVSDIIAKTLGTLVPGQLQAERDKFLPTQANMDLMKLIRPDLVRGLATGGGGFGGGSSFLDEPWSLGDESASNMNNPYSPWYRGNAFVREPRNVNAPPTPRPVSRPYEPSAITTGPGSMPTNTVNYGPWTPISSPAPAPMPTYPTYQWPTYQEPTPGYDAPTIYGEY